MSRSTRTKKLATENPLSRLLSRRRFLASAASAASATALSLSAASRLHAAAFQGAPKITATDLAGLMLFQGAGCNVVAMRGGNSGASIGALMIDGGLAANADALLKAVKERTGNNRIHTLINTHWHPEQVGANELVGRDGGIIFAHEKTKLFLGNAVTSETFKGRFGPLPKEARPNKTTNGDGSMEFDGHRIDYGYMPAAHTDGDLYVHFPEMNVLVGGGPVSGEQWPILDFRDGAWFGGRVRAFQKLAAVVRPDTRVVPAQGRLITGNDIMHHRDIYLELFQTMIAYMNMGLGAEDVVARNPLKKYQSELGDPSVFLNGAYRSMQIAYVPD